MEAVDSIDTLKDGLQSVRDSVDVYHRDSFGGVDEMCREVGTEQVIPRLCGNQCHHAN